MYIEKALSKTGIVLLIQKKKQLSYLNMGSTLHLPQLTSCWDQAFILIVLKTYLFCLLAITTCCSKLVPGISSLDY